MSDAKKAVGNIILPPQNSESTKEKTELTQADKDGPSRLQEMPTVSTLLRRKRLAVKSAGSISATSPVAKEPKTQRPNEEKKLVGPPKFCKELALEKLDLKLLQKKIRQHRRSLDLKKLDCLGYFSSRFNEMAFFEMTDENVLQGVLGFGNPQLVSEITNKMFSVEVLPGVFDLLSQSEAYVGAVEGLRDENQSGLTQVGFQVTAGIAVIPVVLKKAIVGVWICTASQVQEMASQEIKALKALVADAMVCSRRWWFW